MELKDFVKNVLVDLDKAVSEANAETARDIRFKGVREHRTAVEFDVAVTVETSASGKGGGEIKVWGLAEIGAKASTEFKNSTVSRVSFGVDIGEKTRAEIEEDARRLEEQFSKHSGLNPGR